MKAEPIKEDVIQEQCIQWFKLRHRNRLIWHTPNGGKRNYYEAAKLKRLGVTPGVPDLAIMEPSGAFHGLFVELKAEKNGLTDHQKGMCQQLADRGYRVELCRSLEEFSRTVDGYFGVS